ncbi:MAG: hypothetical protein M3Y60_06175, partial [Bacteroidota bacterium]|nr:hypothetical protein [Bacteroidota bacterium]
MNIKSTIGGLAGACTLTLLNESVKRLDKDAPRMDLLGMNAVARLMKGNNILTQTADKLLPVALAGDLISNSLYYSMADTDDEKNTLIRGALLGLGAGLGAVVLPKSLGLNEDATTRTLKTKILTVTWYVIGGLAAAAAMNLMNNKTIQSP